MKLVWLASLLACFLLSSSVNAACGPNSNWQEFDLQTNIICSATGTYTCSWTQNATYTTVLKFCMSAHPSCYQAGTKCAAYIGTNVVDLSSYVQYYPIIWLQVTWEDSGWNDQCRGDCNDIKHKIAALPRILAKSFPGLDRDRVWLVGFSAGVGGINRGTVDSSKGYDRSPYGSTSELFAGAWYLGGCPGGGTEYGKSGELIGNWHVIAVNGETDIFAADGCLPSLQQWAVRNNCSKPNANWCNVGADDPLFPGTQANSGSNKAVQIDFGDCPGGDVQAYRFAGEGHVTSASTNFNPKISFTDIAWAWSQGRSKRLNTAAALTPVPQCSAVNAAYNATAANPSNWVYSRADAYAPGTGNPKSYYPSYTGDPFDFPNPSFVPKWIATSAAPVVPAVNASIEFVGWQSMVPLASSATDALLSNLSQITGEPVSRFSVATTKNFGHYVSVIVLVPDASGGKTGAQLVSELSTQSSLSALSAASVPVVRVQAIGSSNGTSVTQPSTTSSTTTKSSTTPSSTTKPASTSAADRQALCCVVLLVLASFLTIF